MYLPQHRFFVAELSIMIEVQKRVLHHVPECLKLNKELFAIIFRAIQYYTGIMKAHAQEPEWHL